MKEAKKFLERHERQKRKVKSMFHYKKILNNLGPETIKKMKEIVKIIYEEMKFYSFYNWEPPYIVELDKNKLKKADLIVSDVEKIIELFTTPSYFILPETPPSPEEGGYIDKLTINLPKQDWNTATQDWNFKYPYEENFKNFYKVITNMNKESKKRTKKPIKETVLYLNQNGELYREPKGKYRYGMGEKSNRHKIVRFLTRNRGYQTTQLIAVEAGNKNEQTTRTEIGKIRKNIRKYLKLNGKDLLQGKKGSGYRINPKYKITLKNE